MANVYGKETFRAFVVEALESLQATIKTMEEKITMAFTNITQLITALDAKTNELALTDSTIAAGITEVASDLAALRALLATSPTPQQLADAQSQLEALEAKLTTHADNARSNADALTVVGQDPQNPLP